MTKNWWDYSLSNLPKNLFGGRKFGEFIASMHGIRLICAIKLGKISTIRQIRQTLVPPIFCCLQYLIYVQYVTVCSFACSYM